MSLVLELPSQLEKDLSAEAAGRGLPLADYVLQLLNTRKSENAMPRTGAELVAYWEREGVIGMRPDITDGQAHARKLRHEAERAWFDARHSVPVLIK